MATRFTLASRFRRPSVVLSTRRLQPGVGRVAGLVGYSLRASPIEGTLATLT